MNREPLPDNSVPWLMSSDGDYYCQSCQKQWLSENTVVWAVYNYFRLAGYASKQANQRNREGDMRVSDCLKTEEWIIEAKGQAPAGNHSTDFQTGLGQILMARSRHGPNIIYAFAMPCGDPFPQLVTQIDVNDRACLRLHWIWVDRVSTPHDTRFEVKIECPPGLKCECQKRIGTFQPSVPKLP